MYLLDCKSLNHSNHVNDDHVKDHDNCDDNNINADPLYLGLLGGVGQSMVWMSIAYTLLEI